MKIDDRPTPMTDKHDHIFSEILETRDHLRAAGDAISDMARLERERDALKEGLEKLMAYQSYAINGSRGGAMGVADVEYHFNKARATLDSLEK
jgi:hypothetical protein